MPSAEQTVFTALSGSTALAAKVGTRIYLGAREPDTVLPAVSFGRLSTEPQTSLSGALLASLVSMQIFAIADTQSEADEVFVLARTALAAAGIPVETRTSLFDADTSTHQAQGEFLVIET